MTASAITAAFADKNAGKNKKSVSVTGALLSDAASFSLDLDKTNSVLGLTAAVSPKQVKVTVTAKDRPYESGNTEVEITGASIADGEIISGETVTLDNITNAK